MNSKLFFLFSMLVFTSCVKNSEPKNENRTIIPIDITKATVFDINKFSDNHISQIHYVPLETTDESLIGKIEKVILYNDIIVIFDEQTNKILLFNRDGSFKKQIGQKGPGPDEYSRLNDIFFEESSGLIYAHERLKNIIFVYNLDGEIINKIKTNFRFNSFCKTKDGFWLYTCFKYNNSNGYNLMLVDEAMQKMIGGYFPQNPNFINVESMTRFRLDSEGIAYFTYPTSNNVYKLSNPVPEILYTIDFGSKTAPYEQIAKIEIPEDYDKLLENDFFKLGDYNIWNDILIFSFSESSLYTSHTSYTGFYNKKDSKINIFKGFIRSKKLPSYSVESVSGQALIFSVFPYELEEDYLEYLEQQVNKKLDDDSNPVLILCYP